MSLKEQVMVVNLTISQWTARKYDGKVSHEIENIHNAKEAGRFNKILLQSNTLKEIGKIATRARTFHYENTLPWGDNGDRILSCEKYFDYVSEIGALKMQYGQLVDQFIYEYVEEKENAKSRLNTMYKEEDYPSEQLLKRKFDILVGFMPVAESGDLRVKLNDGIVNGIRQQITKELENRIEAATVEMLNRLRSAVSHMQETLLDTEKIFRDSLVGNIQSLVETLPLMNFNKDNRVTEAVSLCTTLLVNPDQLRNNNKLRKEIAEKAKQILQEI